MVNLVQDIEIPFETHIPIIKIVQNLSLVLLHYTFTMYKPRVHSSGGSKGGAEDAHLPPGVEILSIPCSFWENLAKSYVGTPLGELVPPPRGNPGSATAQHKSMVKPVLKTKDYLLLLVNS